jgi:hypothetical protein
MKMHTREASEASAAVDWWLDVGLVEAVIKCTGGPCPDPMGAWIPVPMWNGLDAPTAQRLACRMPELEGLVVTVKGKPGRPGVGRRGTADPRGTRRLRPIDGWSED